MINSLNLISPFLFFPTPQLEKELKNHLKVKVQVKFTAVVFTIVLWLELNGSAENSILLLHEVFILDR